MIIAVHDGNVVKILPMERNGIACIALLIHDRCTYPLPLVGLHLLSVQHIHFDVVVVVVIGNATKQHKPRGFLTQTYAVIKFYYIDFVSVGRII